MTTNGKTVHTQIKEFIQTLERQNDNLSSKVYEAEQRISQLMHEQETAYNRLSTIYLPELDAQSIKQTLPEMQRDVQSIYLEKQNRRKQLDELILNSRQSKDKLEEKLDSVNQQLTEKGEERDDTKAKIAKELAENQRYTELNTNAQHANEKINQNKKRLETFSADAEKKLVPYKENRLFMYLVNRLYCTPEHKGIPLTRKLDAWVAKIVNYEQTKRDYDLLLVMPSAVECEIKRRQDELNVIIDAIKTFESQISQKYGLQKILDDGNKLMEKRDNIMTEIEAVTKEYGNYTKERGEIDNTKDEYHQKCLARLKNFIKGESISLLKQRARTTSGVEDDNLVSRLEEVDGEIKNAKKDAKTVKAAQEELAKKIEELNNLKSAYTKKQYDGSRSRFKSGFDVNPMLTGYMTGSMTTESILGSMKKHHYFEEEPSYSSSSSSAWNSSSLGGFSSNSSHSTGGGFGGSGFSSGGGFGGGGFSTGGGF